MGLGSNQHQRCRQESCFHPNLFAFPCSRKNALKLRTFPNINWNPLLALARKFSEVSSGLGFVTAECIFPVVYSPFYFLAPLRRGFFPTGALLLRALLPTAHRGWEPRPSWAVDVATRRLPCE